MSDKIYQDIVESDGKSILVNALAGSGKTTLLTKRIKYRLEKGLVKEDELMVCTFTRDAASDLRHRTGIKFGVVGTIHSIVLGLLRDSGEKIVIVDDVKKKGIIFELMKKYRCKSKYFPEIFGSSSFEKNVNLNYYKDVINDYFDDKKNQIYQIKYEYEKYKNTHSMLDFGDMCLKMYWKLKLNPEYLDSIQERFKEIYLDEAQDCSPVQIETIMLIADKYKRIFAVGDKKQKIYTFITG